MVLYVTISVYIVKKYTKNLLQIHVYRSGLGLYIEVAQTQLCLYPLDRNIFFPAEVKQPVLI